MGRKKKEGEENEYMSHKVSYKWIRKTQVIPEYVVFYKNVGILLGVYLTVKN
jgi:hypothetical protein